MSETVAGTLIDVLEKIGVGQIFRLIADSLNPNACFEHTQTTRA
jgi:hypothetical protein